MNRTVSTPEEFLYELGTNARIYGGLKHYAGGAFVMLLRKYGDVIPPDFVVGKTFRIRRKYVLLLDKRFSFPFNLTDFFNEYESRLKGTKP